MQNPYAGEASDGRPPSRRDDPRRPSARTSTARKYSYSSRQARTLAAGKRHKVADTSAADRPAWISHRGVRGSNPLSSTLTTQQFRRFQVLSASVTDRRVTHFSLT